MNQLLIGASGFRRCIVSPCEKYRYLLEDSVPGGGAGSLCWLMINPSTADSLDDDATIRKVRGFTQRLGFARWVVVNLFAFRTKDIEACRGAHEQGIAIGPDNDIHIRTAVGLAGEVVCAWGPKPWCYPRAHAVTQMLRTSVFPLPRMRALGFAKDGAPFHPLMQPYARPLVVYSERA